MMPAMTMTAFANGGVPNPVPADSNWSKLDKAMMGEAQGTVDNVFEVTNDTDTSRTITLLTNITAETSDSSLTVIPSSDGGKSIMLDLNGYVLDRGLINNSGVRTEDASGSAIEVASGGALTIDDSNTGGNAYKFSVLSSGLWKYVGAWSNGSDTESETVKKVSGGVITGGTGSLFRLKNQFVDRYEGGAVIIYGSGSITMENGYLCGNYPKDGGGGASVTDNEFASFIMNGGHISGNRADDGGGVVAQNNSSFTMNNGEISYNKTNVNGAGVGVFNDAKFIMNDGLISNNSSGYGGGGIHSFKASTTINGGTIKNNSTTKSGGGIGAYERGTLTVKNAEITNNTALNCGGGIFAANYITYNMSEATVSANAASESVGGIYLRDVTAKIFGKNIVKNNTCDTSGQPLNLATNSTLKITGALTDSEIYCSHIKATYNSSETKYGSEYNMGSLTSDYITQNPGATLEQFFHFEGPSPYYMDWNNSNKDICIKDSTKTSIDSIDLTGLDFSGSGWGGKTFGEVASALTYNSNGVTSQVFCFDIDNEWNLMTSSDSFVAGKDYAISFFLLAPNGYYFPCISQYEYEGTITPSSIADYMNGVGKLTYDQGVPVPYVESADIWDAMNFYFEITVTSSTPDPTPGPTEPTTPTEEYTVPVEAENSVQIETTITDGKASVNEITKESIDKVAKSSGDKSTTDTIKIDLSNAKQDVKGVVLTKPTVKNLADATASKKNDIQKVEIALTKATVTLDAKALKAINDQAKGDTLQLVVDDTKTDNLNDSQKSSLSKYNVNTTFEAYFESNGQRIHDFKGGIATVSMKFEPEKGKNTKYYKIYYVADNGKMTKYATKYEKGTLKFATTHFSDYAVVYDTSADVLLLNAKTSGSKAVKLSWNGVDNATKYVVYGAKCGKNFKKLKTVKGKSYTVKKLDAHKAYKFYVVAKDAVGNNVKSKTIHFVTANTQGKYANVKSIKAKYDEMLLSVGISKKLGATYKMYSGKKHIKKTHGVALRYISTNPEVAKVNSSGKVTGISAGAATIYIQDIGGKYCKTKVTVE